MTPLLCCVTRFTDLRQGVTIDPISTCFVGIEFTREGQKTTFRVTPQGPPIEIEFSQSSELFFGFLYRDRVEVTDATLYGHSVWDSTSQSESLLDAIWLLFDRFVAPHAHLFGLNRLKGDLSSFVIGRLLLDLKLGTSEDTTKVRQQVEPLLRRQEIVDLVSERGEMQLQQLIQQKLIELRYE